MLAHLAFCVYMKKTKILRQTGRQEQRREMVDRKCTIPFCRTNQEKKEKNGFSAKIGQQKRVAEVLRVLVFFPVQLAG